jgi:hypothetical protein
MGAHFRDTPDDELYDSFVNHMRFFNINEVTTIGELNWVRRQDEEGRAVASNAYQIFDSLGNVFTMMAF